MDQDWVVADDSDDELPNINREVGAWVPAQSDDGDDDDEVRLDAWVAYQGSESGEEEEEEREAVEWITYQSGSDDDDAGCHDNTDWEAYATSPSDYGEGDEASAEFLEAIAALPSGTDTAPSGPSTTNQVTRETTFSD